MIEKKIGKIISVRFGYGGYQEAQFGVSFSIGSDKGSWVVGDFCGMWAHRFDGAEWTLEDQDKYFAQTTRKIIDLCDKAKVKDVTQLKDIPVEVEFEDMTLKSWRVLEEVI